MAIEKLLKIGAYGVPTELADADGIQVADILVDHEFKVSADDGAGGTLEFTITADSVGNTLTATSEAVVTYLNGILAVGAGDLVPKGQMDDALAALVSGAVAKEYVDYVFDYTISGTTTVYDAIVGIDDPTTEVITAGQYFLNIDDNLIYKAVSNSGSDSDTRKNFNLEITTTADGDRSEVAATGDTRMVSKDLLDSENRENEALYAFNGSTYIKIGTINWQFATGVDLTSGFVTKADSYEGIANMVALANGDDVEKAIAKLTGALNTVMSPEGATLVEYTPSDYADWSISSGDLPVDDALDEIANNVHVNADAITALSGVTVSLQDAYDEGQSIVIDSTVGNLDISANGSNPGVMDVRSTLNIYEQGATHVNVTNGKTKIINDASAPGTANNVYTLPYLMDSAGTPAVVTAADFVMTAGNQDIDDEKNFSDIELNAEFFIGDRATSSNQVGSSVTAVALTAITDGSNGDPYHTHGSNSASLTTDATGVTQYDMVYISAANIVSRAFADDMTHANVIGMANATVGGSTSVALTLPGGIVSGILGSAGVANQRYFLADGAGQEGKVSTVIPTASGHVILEVGTGVNAADMLFNIRAPRVRA